MQPLRPVPRSKKRFRGSGSTEDMDDLEAIRQRRLRELQQQQQQAAGAQDTAAYQAQAEEAEAQDIAIERFLQSVLEPEARERLTRIRMSRPEVADTVIRHVLTIYQQGQLKGRLGDEQLRQLLARLTPEDRETKITRK